MATRNLDFSGLADDDGREPRSAFDLIRDTIAAIPNHAWLRESHVARRMTQERERRKWSQERLAREMKRHGFSLPQSSISKIEKPPYGSTRRAISLDEAVGLATVFEMSLLELLSPPGRYGTQAVADLVAGADLAGAVRESEAQLQEAVDRVAFEFVNHPDDFGPILAGEAARLCDAAGIDYGADMNRALVNADPSRIEPPARHQLIFLQAVLRAAEQLTPRPGRGPRKGKS